MTGGRGGAILLRLATGLLGPQYAAGIRKNMESLKRYIESGRGPKTTKK